MNTEEFLKSQTERHEIAYQHDLYSRQLKCDPHECEIHFDETASA